MTFVPSNAVTFYLKVMGCVVVLELLSAWYYASGSVYIHCWAVNLKMGRKVSFYSITVMAKFAVF